MKKFNTYSKKTQGCFISYFSIVLNIVLFVLKLVAGILTGSVAVMADAWHTLSDSFTSVIVIGGFFISEKPADSQHPFGHQRAESIAAIIIGTLLAIVGISFFKDSVLQLISKKTFVYNSFTVWVFVSSVLLKEAIAFFTIRLGKKLNSKSLIVDGWHHRSDAFASLIILFGFIFGTKHWWIDGILGIIVSLIILYIALETIIKNSNNLMGEKLSVDLKESILEKIYKIDSRISEVHHFHYHKYGDHVEITFHINLPAIISIQEGHEIANRIEKSLKDNFLIEATVHVEPYGA
ncbi:MAG: cation diffusion facilitator family transporter [Pseudomonadota bacterium]